MFLLVNVSQIARRQANLIKVTDSIGHTPFHYAALCENLQAIKLFLVYYDVGHK